MQRLLQPKLEEGFENDEDAHIMREPALGKKYLEKRKKRTEDEHKEFKKMTVRLQNFEVIMKGEWEFPILPLEWKEYFYCHENGKTILGIRLHLPMNRKDLIKTLRIMQLAMIKQDLTDLSVDVRPILNTDKKYGVLKEEYKSRKDLNGFRSWATDVV